MPRHADLGAILLNGTKGTKRRDRSAQVLTERNEKIVVFDPIRRWKNSPQGKFGFLGVFRPDKPQSVGDPVDVGIDTNPKFSEGERHHEIGRLSSDSF